MTFPCSYNNDENTRKLYMTDLEFKPIQKFFRVVNSSTQYSKKN